MDQVALDILRDEEVVAENTPAATPRSWYANVLLVAAALFAAC